MYVYFVRCKTESFIENAGRRRDHEGGNRHRYFYKIGVAVNISRRMAQLQTGCPMRLELVGSVKCGGRKQALALERRLHAAFDGPSRVGEWFILHVHRRYAVKQLLLSWPVADIELGIKQWKAEARHMQQRMLEVGRAKEWPSYVDAPIERLNRTDEIDSICKKVAVM